MFKNVSIILPALNETFSFIQTVDIILEECNKEDICELIAVVCEKTTKECLEAIESSKAKAEEQGVTFHILWQTLPFAGGAVRDGIMSAKGSHILMMAPDLETDPHAVKTFIKMAKKYPKDMITASRWIKKKSFSGYSKIKLVLNYIFQKVFALFYMVKLTDITFGYRLFTRKLGQSIAWEELKHPFFLETALKPIRLKVKIHEIPVGWTARQEGESQNSFLATFKYLGIAFRARFMNPKKILKPGISYKSIRK